jgi:hypothetical protein
MAYSSKFLTEITRQASKECFDILGEAVQPVSDDFEAVSAILNHVAFDMMVVPLVRIKSEEELNEALEQVNADFMRWLNARRAEYKEMTRG